MRVHQLMTKPVVTCSSEDTLNDAAQLMWEHDYGAIPVVSKAGELVGIITDRDIAISAFTQGCSLHSIRVSTAMARIVHTVDGKASLEDVEDLMRSKRVRRVPVVENGGRPIGLISLTDLARHANAPTQRLPHVDRMVVETLASIGEPHGQVSETSNEEQPLPRVNA